MTTTENPPQIQVVALDKASMERGLDTAVDLMIKMAVKDATQGILVTRLEHHVFRVPLSSAVPYGYTQQHDARC
ncbi:hypothetical protein [Arthrobacter sp. NicSoilB8]|uniref:hypothetical protein n=1 Tax=Arthrobacter sp. NicSoilB8 TaxID=2830998 RepID=UPI001CC7C3F4|nr:hypothetical protein [Arthrobacter sp. NicSoilB8]